MVFTEDLKLLEDYLASAKLGLTRTANIFNEMACIESSFYNIFKEKYSKCYFYKLILFTTKF